MRRRVCIWVAGITLMAASLASAQDQTTNTPEELNRKYQESLTQLKAAQDRKNELATENEKLTARIAELEKKLEDAKREASTFAEQTFHWRSQVAAWETFLNRYPLLSKKWKLFMEKSPLAAPTSLPDMGDLTAPLTAE